ncbi:hypothetical protein P8C59_004547 [Phyllachora maydis]|uniref:Uncharacterized protein n=1 Tax=Phyllachora maydis TaxID=1825666 RepID=A0AAD9I2I5_9PEZI|nr:hypothetical protein P8C59_004547 [Phyllachora maydis]
MALRWDSLSLRPARRRHQRNSCSVVPSKNAVAMHAKLTPCPSIVELSGSGKSNVAGLAERLYDPEHGHHLVKFLANLVTADATAMSGLSGTILGTPLSVTVDLVSGIALAHMIARKLASVLVALAPVLVAFIGAGKSTIMPHLSLL